MPKQRERLKVSAKTRPQILAGAIAKFLTEDKVPIEIIAVGAGANNQCVKGLIMARRFISSTGADYAFKPAFETLDIDGKEVTAIKWLPVEL